MIFKKKYVQSSLDESDYFPLLCLCFFEGSNVSSILRTLVHEKINSLPLSDKVKVLERMKLITNKKVILNEKGEFERKIG